MVAERTRAEHVAWCKQRALEYVDSGDLTEALASMCSDLGKHLGTRSLQQLALGLSMSALEERNDPVKMRKFIEGFN